MIYGEKTTSPPPVDAMYQFFTIMPLTSKTCKLKLDIHFEAKSIVKKLMISMMLKKTMRKNIQASINELFTFVSLQKN